MNATAAGPMTQAARYPAALAELIERLKYRAGWRFALADLDRASAASD